MKAADKANTAKTVANYLMAQGNLFPTFKEFDQAWYELHKTRNLPYPDISLRVAHQIYRTLIW